MGAMTLHGITHNPNHLIIIILSLCKNFDFASSSDASLAHPFSSCHSNSLSSVFQICITKFLRTDLAEMVLSLGKCVCVCATHAHMCECQGGGKRLNRQKGECALRLNHVDLTLKSALSFLGRRKSYEHPFISKHLSHHSHLRAVAIAVFPPGIFSLKTITHTLYCTQVSGQVPLTQIGLPWLPSYLKSFPV